MNFRILYLYLISLSWVDQTGARKTKVRRLIRHRVVNGRIRLRNRELSLDKHAVPVNGKDAIKRLHHRELALEKHALPPKPIARLRYAIAALSAPNHEIHEEEDIA